MVTRRYQRDYQNLNLHKTIQEMEPTSTHRHNGQKIPKRLSEPKSTHRQYNGHKKIPKRLSEPKSTQDNTMVQEDTKEIIRT